MDPFTEAQLNKEGYAPNQSMWWRLSKDDAFRALWEALEHLDKRQNNHRQAMIHFQRMYSNRPTASSSGQAMGDSPQAEDRMRINVSKSCVDAATAQIATRRPSPMYKTFKGNFMQRRRAENLRKFVLGWFIKLSIYQLALEVFRDACVYGSGYLKIFPEDGGICCERVFPMDIVVDQMESQDGIARQIFQATNVPKEFLMELYRDDKRIQGIIPNASRLSDRDDYGDYESLADMATLIEGYHVPSGPDTGDGRKILLTSDGYIVDREYNRPHPFVKFDWTSNPRGFQGMGLVEEISPIQLEIHSIGHKIQRLMTLATSIVVVPKGTGLRKLSNKDWNIIETPPGQAPVFHNISSVSPEYFRHLDRLIAMCYELAGISQLSAQSVKPAGLDSGTALRTYHDIGSQRFQHVGQRWEQFFLDVAERILECAREIEEESPGDLKVLAHNDKDIEEISFKDCALETDMYIVQPWPVSLIPDTPAGKIEAAGTMIQMMPAMEPYMPRLIGKNNPDLDAVIEDIGAPKDIADMQIALVLEKGKLELPIADMDLTYAKRAVTQAICRAELDEVEEDKISALRRYSEEVSALQEAGMPPEVTMVPGAPPGPSGPPGPAGAPPAGMPPQMPPM